MSSRANASAKAKRAGGASLSDNNKSSNEMNQNDDSTLSSQKTVQAISVKQAIVLLNTKINNLSQHIQNNNLLSIENNDKNIDVKYGTLEMRLSELQKKYEQFTNELNEVKNKEISNLREEIKTVKNKNDELKDMLLKIQSNVTDLQTAALKNKN